jgi:hypothetical protein
MSDEEYDTQDDTQEQLNIVPYDIKERTKIAFTHMIQGAIALPNIHFEAAKGLAISSFGWTFAAMGLFYEAIVMNENGKYDGKGFLGTTAGTGISFFEQAINLNMESSPAEMAVCGLTLVISYMSGAQYNRLRKLDKEVVERAKARKEKVKNIDDRV